MLRVSEAEVISNCPKERLKHEFSSSDGKIKKRKNANKGLHSLHLRDVKAELTPRPPDLPCLHRRK